MKLVRISSIPPKLVASIYQEFETKLPSSYEDGYQLYFNRFIAISDAITHELNQVEGFSATEIVFNHELLQKAWMKQFKSLEEKNPLEIVRHQLDFYQPDVILVNTGLFEESDIRAIAPATCFIMAWDGFVTPLLQKNKPYDLILTCLDTIQQKYQTIGTPSEILHFAFDPRVLDFVSIEKTEFCTFSGSISPVHLSRQDLLYRLTKAPIDFHLYLGNYDTGYNPFSRTILREILQNKNILNLFKVVQLQAKNNTGGWGIDMYQILARSIATLNFHGDEVKRACNIRLFEATGLNTCLVTDDLPGLSDFYEKDKEVVAFSGIDDLIDKLIYLEKNPQHAKQIGEAGKQKVFAQHLWKHRVQELISIIHKHI